MAIHPTAVIDKRAQIAPSAQIGPFTVVEGPVTIHENVKVGPHACLYGWTTIGRDCEIHAGAVIGDLPQDRAFTGERSYCEIGPETVIREYVTIHRGTMPESKTIVGSGCLLCACSHVAHNCIVGDNVTIINAALLAGHVQIGPRAVISAQAAFHQFCRVGELVMVSGGASITTDIPPFMLAHERNKVSGINRVGLKRADMPGEEIDEIRLAHRLLYRSNKVMSESIKELDRTLTTPAGRRLVDFLLAEHKRPLLRPHRE